MVGFWKVVTFLNAVKANNTVGGIRRVVSRPPLIPIPLGSLCAAVIVRGRGRDQMAPSMILTKCRTLSAAVKMHWFTIVGATATANNTKIIVMITAFNFKRLLLAVAATVHSDEP